MAIEGGSNAIKDYLNVKAEIVESLQLVDGENFLIDSWQLIIQDLLN